MRFRICTKSTFREISKVTTAIATVMHAFCMKIFLGRIYFPLAYIFPTLFQTEKTDQKSK